MSNRGILLALAMQTPPAPPGPGSSHTFTIVVGVPFGVSGWRGWKQADTRSVEQGSATNTTFNTPDGVSRQIQFIIAMTPTSGRIELTDLTPEAQMPDRIVFVRGSMTQTWGNRTGYADRFGAQADYSRTAGDANVFPVLESGETATITLHWN